MCDQAADNAMARGANLSIRPASLDDAPAIAELLGQLGYPSAAAEVGVRLANWASAERSRVIGADLDGRLAGVAAVHAIPLLEHSWSRGRLVALVVDEAARGQGIGRALVAAAERQACAFGCRELDITSARDRPAAHRLYSALGYTDASARAARFLKALDAR
jgi:GNAT superfamily N-acetyltransferase